MWFALLGLFGLAAAAAAAEGDPLGDPEPVEESDTSWYLVPAFSYDTDDGLGAGARFEWARSGEGYYPYKAATMVHLFWTNRGFRHHRFRFDRLGMGEHGRLRLTARFAWRQWKNDGYWGIGNGTTREVDYAGSYEVDDPRRTRYRYSLYQPFLHVALRVDLGEDTPWQAFWALNPKWSFVEPYAGSLLEEQQPYGVGGGPSLQLMGGMLYDSREPEVATRSGWLLELSGRVNPSVSPVEDGQGWESGSFLGVLASARWFWTPTSGLTFASRFMSEWLEGQVPFYEMVHWGGALPVSGFGGAMGLRGARFGRWRAPGKAVLNLEARVDTVTVHIGEAPLTLELAPFVDLGAVYGADEATAEAPANPVHPAMGSGFRLRYDETFVGRIDTAFGLDPVTLADGSVVQRTNFGIYVVFDHPF